METPSVHPREMTFETQFGTLLLLQPCIYLKPYVAYYNDTLIGGAVASPTQYRGRYSESDALSASPESMEVETYLLSCESTWFLGRPRYVESLGCRDRFGGGRGFDLATIFFDRHTDAL